MRFRSQAFLLPLWHSTGAPALAARNSTYLKSPLPRNRIVWQRARLTRLIGISSGSKTTRAFVLNPVRLSFLFHDRSLDTSIYQSVVSGMLAL
ncbi:MAG: hypothetical protein DLM68_16580 [Hyphomicrobiales bacterium]|nr:MAG: hypothetical protein DLM68_16580 [Hyphomicrobiales bacterium]